MIIKPRFRGFICTTAHPEGCKANVLDMVNYVKQQPRLESAPKRVLVIGSSTGYGLATRIAYAFGAEAATVGVFFEKEGSERRTGTAGYYNNRAFEQFAAEQGLAAYSVNGDAFSKEIKRQTIDLIKEKLGQVDAVFYSLASPRRTDPETGEVYSSVIKPIGEAFHSRTVDFHTGEVSDVTVEPATEEEIAATVKVMGGEDWALWIEALREADALAPDCFTAAYSYIGPELTHAVYKDGTIGKAKEDLERVAASLDIPACISVNKAVVTQSSSAIPVVPLYISLLYKVMKEKGNHENCIQQMARMAVRLKEQRTGRLRLDDWEMEPEVQAEVLRRWEGVTTENLPERGDIEGFREEFFQLFGFGREDIDYEADVDPR